MITTKPTATRILKPEQGELALNEPNRAPSRGPRRGPLSGGRVEGFTPVLLNAAGDAVAGRIIGVSVALHLETAPGEKGSRVTLWLDDPAMGSAIGDAMARASRAEIRLGDDVALTRADDSGYTAAYSSDGREQVSA